MAADVGELPRNPVRWKHEIHAAGGDSALRHALLKCRVILSESDTARSLDLFETERAVAPGPRQDNADRSMGLVLGKRTKELIDRPVLPVRLTGDEMEDTVGNEQVLPGRHHIDTIGLDARLILDLRDRHGRRSRENLRQGARVGRREVLHQNERHPGIDGERMEKLGQSFEPAGGGPDPHYRA